MKTSKQFSIQQIPLEKLFISNLNTRKDLRAGSEDSAIEDLAADIGERGLINPITVRPWNGGKFEIVSGQRRFLACKKLGWKTISATVRDLSDEEATIVSFAENVHRAEMNAMDKALTLEKLMAIHKSPEQVADKTKLRPETVRKYLDLLSLAPEIQNRVSTYDGPAKVDALSKLSRTFKDPGDQVEVYDKIAPFSQRVQQAIIKESKGDISKIDGLVAAAEEGAFDRKICGLPDCVQKISDRLPRSLRKEFKVSCQPILEGDNEEFTDGGVDMRLFKRLIRKLREDL